MRAPHHFSTVVLSLICTAASFTQAALVTDGKSDYVIILSRDASPSEKRGAAEIQSHLKQMSGADLPVLTEIDQIPAKAILVGQSRHTDALGVKLDSAKLGNEGFALKTVGDRIVIAGGRLRGTMYGCSTFLETLGVRWFTNKVTFIPKRPNIELPKLDEQQTPAFEYREPYFTEAFDKDWAARLKMNGQAMRLDASTGGKVTYHGFVHTLDSLVPRSLYATHPEYFPLVRGQRKNGYVQRCLSNPDVLKLVIANLRDAMKKHPEAMIFSVSQNDCGDYCECDNCKAIEAKYGAAHSGVYLWFVNEVAAAVENEFPDKLIDTIAYQFTEKAPTGITPRKNVRIRLCPISVCEAHPYESCSDKANVAFMQNLRDWSKIAGTLYIWHYNTNFANYLMPFPDFNQFPDSIQLYKRSGVVGIFFEGAYMPGGGGAEADLRSYVMAKLLWNPSLDVNAMVGEWMAGVYGPAAKPMRQWFDLLHEKVRDPNKHFHIYDPPTVYYMSADVIAKGDQLFDEAQKLAADNALASEYIAKERLGMRYVKLMQKPTVGPEFDSFMADVHKFKIGQLREGQPTAQWEREYRARVKN